MWGSRMSRKGDILIFAALIAVIVTGIMILHLPTFIPLMVCTVIVSLYAILFLKKNISEILKAILGASLKAPWPLLLAIGALIASWVQCGAVPYLVAKGLMMIKVRFFLPLVLLICTAMSAVTGSSWTTCGTLGIAFIGMSARSIVHSPRIPTENLRVALSLIKSPVIIESDE